MAPMMHPRHQPFKLEGVYMSDTGGLIVYKINGWKITTMKIRGVLEHPEHPPGYAPDVQQMLD